MAEEGKTNLALVTMNQQRMVALVQDSSKNVPHDINRDSRLLGALNANDNVMNAIGCGKVLKSIRELIIDQSARRG